jgi:hypothetical protein
MTSLSSTETARENESDAQWLRNQSENLVRYEEDAQRMRKIAKLLEALTGALEGLVRQHGCARIPGACRTPADAHALAVLAKAKGDSTIRSN